MLKRDSVMMIITIFAALMCNVSARPDVFRASMVLDSPSFPAPALEGRISLNKRTSENPICEFTRGVAYIKPTAINIDHLRDEKETYCVAEAGNCARVSYLNDSSIFFCNYNADPIFTKCGNLIEPARVLFNSCQVASRYTYGYLRGMSPNGSLAGTVDGPEVAYYLRLGAELP